MKLKPLSCVLMLALALAGLPQTSFGRDADTEKVAVEVVVRPVCFSAMIVGSVLFLAVLPYAAISRSIGDTADALIGKPARATFTREIGDFDSFD